MSAIPISGSVAPGFEPILEAFETNFAEDKELGAGFSVYLDGKRVVHLYGGWSDQRKTKAWTQTTLTPIYSTTKPIAALTLASVIDTLDAGYETCVAELWPEFAAKGKQHLTLAQMLSHQGGLPGFVAPIDPQLWLDPPACAALLAQQAPLWIPGTTHGYHPLTWGYLIGELVLRIAGRTLGTILGEDITKPANIDFYIGTPRDQHDRIAEIMRPRSVPHLGEINPETRAAFLTKWASPNRGGTLWREIEIPSANGHGTADSVARLYSIFAQGGKLEGRRVVSEAAFAALTQSRVKGQDLVLPFITEFSAGAMRNNLGLYGPNPETLCHAGWGGSMALGDPARKLSAAYVMNRQSNSLQGDPRATRLVQALYRCL